MELYVHRVLRQWSDGANRKIAHLVVIAGGDGAQEKTPNFHGLAATGT